MFKLADLHDNTYPARCAAFEKLDADKAGGLSARYADAVRRLEAR